MNSNGGNLSRRLEHLTLKWYSHIKKWGSHWMPLLTAHLGKWYEEGQKSSRPKSITDEKQRKLFQCRSRQFLLTRVSANLLGHTNHLHNSSSALCSPSVLITTPNKFAVSRRPSQLVSSFVKVVITEQQVTAFTPWPAHWDFWDVTFVFVRVSPLPFCSNGR